MSAVELAGVEVAYDGKAVVHDLDLDVPVGGWLGLIGPNGSGKTTILRAMAGLVPHRGRIALCGTEIAELGGKQVARLVAIVRQEPSLPAGMSLTQYVLLGRSSYFSYLGKETRQDREIIAEMLERLSLAGLATRPLDTLSGGERQRAAMARALVQQAPILLVDEPTSALDVGRQQDVLDLIDGVRRDRVLTVVAAMHDLTLAGQYADRLALIVGGRLIECGAPADVLTEAAIGEHYSARVRVRAVNDSVRAVVPDRTMAHADRHIVPSQAPRPARVRAQSVVIVNTGHGKGKSTAAFGTVLRGVARGWKVCVIQFVKSGNWKVGEEASARRLGVEWWTAGDGFTWNSADMDRTEALAREGWRAAREKLASGDYGLVVLDEVTYPMNWGWIPVSDVVAAIRSRPPAVNVIATGRDAPEELVECADTVTEMRNRKHAFDRGVRAIRGIDF